MSIELRPYQIEAIDAVAAAWSDHDDALISMATGTGKTIVFSSIAAEQVSVRRNVLILAHQKELLYQARDKLHSVHGITPSFELGRRHWSGGGVCISSAQTMVNRLGRFDQDTFNTVIIDECHHSMSATYRRIIDHYSDAKLLGVTATPDRGDRQNLGEVFPHGMTYEYGLRRAIEGGYLCRIRVEQIPVEVDLRRVRTVRREHGNDYSEKDLSEAIAPKLEDCAIEIIKRCDRSNRVLVFLPTIQLAASMAETINSRARVLPDGSRSLTAEMICGKSSDREKILDRFRRGETNVLCNVVLLTEGWDEPSVDTICVLRPTKSRTLYAQMVGRGTRLHDGKPYLRLLDMMCLAREHDLCKPANLLVADENISGRVDDEGDLLEMVADAEAEIEREERNAEEERRASAERALRHNRGADEYDLLDRQRRPPRRKLISANEYRECVGLKPPDILDVLNDCRPTEKQLSALRNFGIDPTTVRGKHEASALIGSLISRKDMATPAQIRILDQKGYDRVNEWTKEEATSMISMLSGARWKTWKLPAYYQPGYLPERLWSGD